MTQRNHWRVFVRIAVGCVLACALLSPGAAAAVPGDANCDGQIDEDDLVAVTARLFAEDGECPDADANQEILFNQHNGGLSR